MPCFKPLHGYRAREKNSSGKYSIVFNHKFGYLDKPVILPCGQCIGCRLERSRQWAIRCMHESQLHEDNCFLTLTFDNDHLNSTGTLVKSDFQKFMKRLRKHFAPKKIRFYHCGEYGEKTRRPHHHALIFGLDFSDKELHKVTFNGDKLYTSETLDRLWGQGIAVIGDVTFDSAAYVARYITKKITGEMADDHYVNVDIITGEVHKLIPEYNTMSRKPGIAKAWYEKFKKDVYPFDEVIIKGKKVRPPKFYDSQYEIESPSEYAKLKAKRKYAAEKHSDNNTRERLEVREKCQQEKFKKLVRSYENEA